MPIKDNHPQSEGVVQSGYFSNKEGSSDADDRTFWCINFGFFEIYVVSARAIRRFELPRTFFGQEGRSVSFFANMCERLLWMAP